MAAKKGNKHGVGHGRPPTPGFEDDNLVKLGEEMLSWLKKNEENPKIVHLSQFYSQEKNIARSQWKSLQSRPSFLPYYEKALEWMGSKILTNPDLPTAYGSRFLAIYFKEVRDHEKEVLEHKVDYELQKKAQMEQNRHTAPNDNQLENLIQSIKSLK